MKARAFCRLTIYTLAMVAFWAFLAVLIPRAIYGQEKTLRRSVVQTMEAFDKLTGETINPAVTVSGSVPIPEAKKNADIGFRPGERSSARVELQLGCSGLDRDTLTAALLVAHAWQSGTNADVLAALERFPKGKTECDMETAVSRWVPLAAEEEPKPAPVVVESGVFQ